MGNYCHKKKTLFCPKEIMVITRAGQLIFGSENCEIKICFVFLTLFTLRLGSCEAVQQNLVFLKILKLTYNFRTYWKENA